MKHSVHQNGTLRLSYLYLTLLICVLFSPLTSSAKSVVFTRTASNTIHCSSGKVYGLWLNLDGYNNYYQISNANFVEFDNGTAEYTALATNNSNSNLQFEIDVVFHERSFEAPAGSPKNSSCGTTHDDYYYYKRTTGRLIGKGHFAGAKITVDRAGEAFQVGTGANVTGPANEYGGSGWLTLDFTDQPNNSNYHLAGPGGDINIMLSGAGCDNLTDGGKIGNTEFYAKPFDPQAIVNLEDPSGGNGQTIQYIWLQTTNPSLPINEWDNIEDANDATYDPGLINETTYFIRCARRFPCKGYSGESNIIAKIVQPNPFSGTCLTGVITEDINNVISTQNNNGVENAHEIKGAIDGTPAKFHTEHDNIIVKLEDELPAGDLFTISWKFRDYTSTFSGPAKLKVYESEDGVNFTFNSTLTTSIKKFYIHENIATNGTTRYLKLVNGAGTPDFDVDAITTGRCFCQQPTICKLNDHGESDKTAGTERLVWMNFDDEGIQEYTVVNNSSKITQFPNGSALLTGTIERVTDPCYKYTYSVRLVNKSDWTSWSVEQGNTYKAGPFDDHENWIYYDVDDANSTFYGLGCHDGEVLDIKQFPVDRSVGFQLGQGGNLKNNKNGLSGWYHFTGDRTGRGDFNGNIDDCVEESAEILLGNKVFEDLNGNGIQDAGEPGINGVKATLIGTTFNGQGVIQNAVTVDGGQYGFGPLFPGRYKVIFSELPGGLFATAKNEGTDVEKDSDVDPINGMTPFKVYGGADNDLGIDAGYFRYADIGNFVWEDTNGNGLREDSENGLPNVGITLTGTDGTGAAVNRTGSTNGSGIYFFDALKPGDYKLTFDQPTGYTATAANQGTDDTIDSDANESTGMTIFENLVSGEMNDTYDAGFYRTAKIGGIAFIDQNNSGLLDAGDEGIEDVKINLLRQNPITNAFEAYDMTLTLEDGTYLFEDVAPGKYRIMFDETTLPAGFFFTPSQNIDGNASDLIDSDLSEDGNISNIMVMSGQPDDLSFGGGIVNQTILPVDLISFEAKLINENEVRLEWLTASETNNNFFVVERSTDGENFLSIGVVNGNGTTDIHSSYNFVDEDPFFGRNYYRLKQVDFDGKNELSDIKLIIVQKEDLPDAIVYPNPTKDFTKVRAVKAFEDDVTIEVVSITGQIEQTHQVSKDMNSLQIDMRDLKAGYYFVKIRYDEFRQVVHRVLKIQD